MKKKKPWTTSSRRVPPKLATNRLLKAVGDWVNSNGGNALVAGNIGLMDVPSTQDPFRGPDPLTFYVVIKVSADFSGRLPVAA